MRNSFYLYICCMHIAHCSIYLHTFVIIFISVSGYCLPKRHLQFSAENYCSHYSADDVDRCQPSYALNLMNITLCCHATLDFFIFFIIKMGEIWHVHVSKLCPVHTYIILHIVFQHFWFQHFQI